MNEVYVFKVQGLTWLGDVRHRACSTQHDATEQHAMDSSDEDTLIMLTMIMLFVVIV